MEFKLTHNYTVAGLTLSQTKTITADAAPGISLTLPAAKTGTLTVRTDNDTGSLTMQSGHGITTGARLDVYWTVSGVNYCRRGMTVGTVASLVVPVDGGSGDVLGPQAGAVTAQIPEEIPISAVGDNVTALTFYSPAEACFVLADASNVLLYARRLSAGQAWAWWYGSYDTNPLAGVTTLTKVFVSQGNSTGSQIVKMGVAYN